MRTLYSGMIAVVLAGIAWSGAIARPAPELAQAVHLDVRTSPESLAVGDRWNIELRVECPAGYAVQLPGAIPTTADAELIEYTPAAGPETLPGESNPRRRYTARYTVALFAVGDIALAPLQVEVRQDSLQTTVMTDSLRAFVTSVLDDSLAAAGIRDLKPQTKLAAARWPWIVGAAIVLLGLALWWWLRRRRKRQATIVPLVPQRPADEVALEALRRLETKRLPLDGKFQEHWVAISEIVRRYLEDGFGLAALEQTSEEILFDLERHGFDRAHVLHFRALADLGDLIKFAKREPTVEECVQATERAREFVTATARRLRTPPAATMQAPGVAARGGEVA